MLGSTQDPKTCVFRDFKRALKIGLKGKWHVFHAAGGDVVDRAGERGGTLFGEKNSFDAEKSSCAKNCADVVGILKRIKSKPKSVTVFALAGIGE